MLVKIIGITDSIVSVHLDINIYDYDNLISKNVVFRDNNIISVGEVIGIDNGIMNAALVGEIKDNSDIELYRKKFRKELSDILAILDIMIDCC